MASLTSPAAWPSASVIAAWDVYAWTYSVRPVRKDNDVLLQQNHTPPNIRKTALYKHIRSCQRCALAATRTHAVYGRGDPHAPLWFVGEAPGREEDAQGLAFIGRSGRLLDLCLRKKNITDYFITNIVKCRPPENRDPDQQEIIACIPWLLDQLVRFKPRVIVAMGRFSIGYFLGFTYPEVLKMTVSKQVGRVRPYLGEDNSLAIMPVYHPAYLLRTGEHATQCFMRQLSRAQALCDRMTHALP